MMQPKSNMCIPRGNTIGERDERTRSMCFPMAGTSEPAPSHAPESPEGINPRG